jgi:rod shape-determining protein MreB
LDERLRQETGVPVHVAEEPMACVVIGSGRFLEEIEFDRDTLTTS